MRKMDEVENKAATPAAPKRRAADQTREDRDRELRASAKRVRITNDAGESEEVDAYTARERVTAAGSTWAYAPTEGA